MTPWLQWPACQLVGQEELMGPALPSQPWLKMQDVLLMTALLINKKYPLLPFILIEKYKEMTNQAMF